MISITIDDGHIVATICARSRKELNDQVRDVHERFSDYLLRDHAGVQEFDGQWFAMMSSTVDLF